MTSFARDFLRRFGVDRAIFYTLVNRGFSAFTGPVSLYLIARCLTREEQGYYFTFASILGLQIVFELGLGYVISILQPCLFVLEHFCQVHLAGDLGHGREGLARQFAETADCTARTGEVSGQPAAIGGASPKTSEPVAGGLCMDQTHQG